jgi:hypothetical protein
MRKIIYALLFLFVASAAYAGPRGLAKAKQIALQLQNGGRALAPSRAVSNTTIQLSYVSQRTSIEDAYYYVFNRPQDKGFVIVSGDDAMPEILAYSDEGRFKWDELPENCKAYLKAYEKETENSANIHRLPNVQKRIKLKSTVQFDDAVNPLIDPIAWSQSTPFNDKCPKDPTTGSISMAGCVAIAMSQVMAYHKWPTQSKDTLISYTTDTKNIKVSSTFNHAYDWENILPVYELIGGHASRIQKKAVALLLADVGVTLHMDYTSKWAAANSSRIPTALHKVFLYDESARMVYRKDYTWNEWMSLIKTELSAQRPIVFRGSSKGGGHAFVCDGYDENGLIHINWGWRGSSNGYFYPTNLKPQQQGIGAGSPEGFNIGQAMIVGIQKPIEGNEDILNRLAFSKYVYSSTQVNKGETMSIDVEDVHSIAYDAFSGIIDLSLYDAQTGEFVKKLAEKNVAMVGSYEYSYTLAFSTASITTGQYRLKARYKKDENSPYHYLTAKYGFAPSLLLNVTENEVILTQPEDEVPSFAVENLQIENLSNDELMQGANYTATFDLTNTSKVDVVSNLAMGLTHRNSGKQTFLDYVPLDLPAGVKRKFTLPFRVFTTLALGDYGLGLYFYTGSQFTNIVFVSKARMNLIQEQDVALVELKEQIPFMESFESEQPKWRLQDSAYKLTSGKSIGIAAVDGENYLMSKGSSSARNAWAYSPKVHLTEGQKIAVSTFVWASGTGFNEEFTVTVGTAQNSQEQSAVLIDKSGDQSESFTTFTEVKGEYTVPATGDYYFAIHICTSKPNGYYLLFDKFQVKEQTPEGVEAIDAVKKVAYVSYFTLTGTTVQQPLQKGCYIKCIHYVDGSVKTEKMVVR